MTGELQMGLQGAPASSGFKTFGAFPKHNTAPLIPSMVSPVDTGVPALGCPSLLQTLIPSTESDLTGKRYSRLKMRHTNIEKL